MWLLFQLTVGLQACRLGMKSMLWDITLIVKVCLFPLLHSLTFLFMVFYHSWKRMILAIKCVFPFTNILTKYICCQLPAASASLSELDPLLSEEPPFFLEVAMGSTGFSTAKQEPHVQYHSNYTDHSGRHFEYKRE